MQLNLKKKEKKKLNLLKPGNNLSTIILAQHRPVGENPTTLTVLQKVTNQNQNPRTKITEYNLKV
jgi:hypothetical protein